MKILKTFAVAAAILGGGASALHAQYYEAVNQLTNMLSPALSGSLRYKGFVDVSALAGVGVNRANFIGISTTQGFTYSDWFFMGVGMGVDVAMARNTGSDRYYDRPGAQPDWWGRPTSKTMAMLPVFSDFRFTIGGSNSAAAFIDIKAGATWLLGNDDLWLADSYMSHGAQFYLKPTIGVRIPVSSANPRQAVNIGVTYQLITSDNYYNYRGSSVTLNNFGATIAYEW